MPRALFLWVICLGCVSCAGGGWLDRLRTPQPAPEFPSHVAPSRPPARAATPGAEVGARMRLDQAEAIATQTRQLLGTWNGADEDLATARASIGARDWNAALAASDEALARAEQAISDHYARLANTELARSYGYAGLDDGQVLQLRAAEEILITGNSRLAYGRLRTLNQQLEKRMKTYTVRSGDSLWVIAGRPEVYANSLLWPLIWQANVAVIPNPDRLRRGQVLKVRPHPDVNAIAEAVDVARGKRRETPGITPSIGEIREAGPE